MLKRGGSAKSGWFALPFIVLACGHDKTVPPWVGRQECSVGIPPEQARGDQIPSETIPLAGTAFQQTGDGFFLQRFKVGPIGGFSCEAVPFQVVARFGTPSEPPLGRGGGPGTSGPQNNSRQNAAAQPPLARPIVVDPFECRATDGRTYLLSGTGSADLRSMFFNLTFSAWLAAGQATLTCITRFTRLTPDAGVSLPPSDVATQPPAAGDGTPIDEAAPSEMAPEVPALPDAGEGDMTESPMPAAAG